MNVSKKQKPIDDVEAVAECLLLANGSSGQWDVAIDETGDKASRYFAQIEGPAVYLYFELTSLAVVTHLRQFLETSHTNVRTTKEVPKIANGSLQLGRFGSTSVIMTRDDEFDDRLFFIVGVSTKSSIRFTLTAADVGHLQEALSQIMLDLKSA